MKLSLFVLPKKFSVCGLDKNTQIPSWATDDDTFFNITKTADELSIVCPESSVPSNIKCETNWRVFKVNGPLDFSLTGILASLAKPLAEAKISIFAISTYETDYLLVKENKLDQAVKVLEKFCEVEL